MRRLLIDTDTASDDAVALLMALRAPDAVVEAITVVAGNVPLDQGVQNALYVRDLVGSPVPVYAGCPAPILRPLRTAEDTHGQDGMGDIGLDLGGRTPSSGHAADVLAQRLLAEPGALTLVTLGPLTNLAVTLLRHPGVVDAIGECVCMIGTGSGPGNTTSTAEFNAWVDPEAVRVVLRSGLRATFVGWDISCAAAVIDPKTEADLRSVGTPTARFAMDIQRQVAALATTSQGLAGFDLPDPIAMAVALDPSSAIAARRPVNVVVGDDSEAGRLDVNWDAPEGGTIATVTHADRAGFLARLRAALS